MSIILLCGVSGSGKTHRARQLEAEGYVRVSTDEIVWQLTDGGLDRLPWPERQAVFGRAAQLLEQRVRQLLDAGTDRIVIDATMCKRAKRDSMRALLRQYGIEPQLVFLDVPRDELLRRLATRHGSGPDDQIVTPAQLASFCQGFERPTPDEGAERLRQL